MWVIGGIIYSQCFFYCHKIARGDFISTLVINILQIRKNILEYKSKLRNDKKFCAVVKANAYGMGLEEIVSEIDDLVDYYAVSCEDEFFRVRKHTKKNVIILDPIYENITNLAKQNCEFCVSNFKQFELFFNLSKMNLNIEFKIHIAFNTGMNRFGFVDENEILRIFDIVKKTQNISIFGVFSHFYQGNDKFLSILQSYRFSKLKDKLVAKFDLTNTIFHISNTSGFCFETQFDMVRIGLGMLLNKNQQCFNLKSKIIEIQNLKSGDTAGYGLKFLASKNMRVAVVSIGYADGVMRKISGRGCVLINGKRCLILAVCMDSIIVDVTNVQAEILNDVIVCGKDGEDEISICEIAAWCDTIEYEIMTNISNRVVRVYIGGTKDANNNGKISCTKTCCC